MKSPLLTTLRQCFLAAQSPHEYRDLPHALPTRRDFLRTSAQAGLVAGGWKWVPNLNVKTQPRVAIIGAGIGGLSTAWFLKQAGIEAQVYEGSRAAGGRIQSLRKYGQGTLVTEAGAEFIDTIHVDLMGLVRELDLELLDVEADPQAGIKETFYFGQHYSAKELVDELRAAMPQIQRSQIGLRGPLKTQLDRMPLAEYIERMPVSEWVKSLFHVAYCAENGLDTGDQSASNMLGVLAVKEEGWLPYGDSDERYKVRGGNDQIPGRLAERLAAQITYKARVEAIEEASNGALTLTIQEDGTRKTATFDAVVLTVPFTRIRDGQMALRVNMPTLKRRVIQELGYGTNAKWIIEMQSRHWRTLGYRGNLYAPEVMNGWDSSHQQTDNQGVGTYTCLLGGAAGLAHAAPASTQLEGVFGGFGAATTGVHNWVRWVGDARSGASYSCFRPGQMTDFEGAAFASVGGLYFAGEHCSTDFWGFMNGAVESARRTAAAIIAPKRRRRRR
jgi:monoamine oxidase